MGFVSFAGMILSFAVIIIGIIFLGGDLNDFLDPASFLMVIIPTFACMAATLPMSVVAKMPAHMKIILGKTYQPELLFGKIYAMSRKARQEGLLSLESEELNDPILDQGLGMVVDAVPEAEIKRSLEDSLMALKERHTDAVALYEKGGTYAPAFGMCGTVVSLVNMLMSLNFDDPSAMNSLGVNMAAALLTTLYGSMFANIIFLPLAGRLKYLSKKELFGKAMICNAILGIARGENPGFIIDSLRGQLNKFALKKIPDIAKIGESGGGGG